MSSHNFNDLTGERFNNWVILTRDIEKENEYKIRTGKKGSSQWICKCICGTVKSLPVGNLTTGKSKSCGCIRKTPPNFKDLTRQKFNRLSVINRAKPIKEQTFWNCICDCGNKLIVQSGKLTSGHTKSCGCLQKEKANETHFNDLTGQKFSNLTVIERNFKYQEKKKSLNTYWDCICLCGNRTTVSSGKLTSRHTKSCGCLNSYGESLIKKYLTKSNILFKNNRGFKDLVSEKGGRYKYDFIIFDKQDKVKYIIEYDGEQHFICTNRYWNTPKRFKELQIRDRIKNKYCFDNNIPLIRIPYTRLQDIKLEDLLLETSNYIITKKTEKDYYERHSKI